MFLIAWAGQRERDKFETFKLFTETAIATECLLQEEVNVKWIRSPILDRGKEKSRGCPVSENSQACYHIE